jgi:hypothetical protein
LPTSERVQTLLAAARRIDESGMQVEDIAVRRPSLDDVFLALTAPAIGGVAPRDLTLAAAPDHHPEPQQATA